MAIYIFTKTPSKPTYLVLSIIFIPLFLAMKSYISLCKRAIQTKTRKMYYNPRTASIGEMDSNVKTYAITTKRN